MRHIVFAFTLILGIFIMSFYAESAEIGFSENFALAPNRDDALKQLIPGTDDYYYYHCVHFQNNAEFDKVDGMLKQWIQRHGENGRVNEIKNRQALLQFDKDPKKAFDFLQWRLGLNFNHERYIPGQKPNYPTELDQKLIAANRLTANALNRHGELSGFDESAVDMLMALPSFTGPNADGKRRRQLLQFVKRPDYPNMAKLVVDDLRYEHSGGFGSLEIHRLLLVDQLDECAKLMPELVNNGNFVNTYLTRLQPNPDVDIKHDLKERLAHLERLWNYASKLSPAYNSLKAHVLFHRLSYDQSQGIYDKERFMEYLKLPRNMDYMRPEYLQAQARRDVQANLSQNFDTTKFPPIQNDEALVRDFLMNFFVKEDSFEPYSGLIETRWLKDVFAEAKIVNGIGDQEKWYSLLDNPTKFQQLKERVDLEFAPVNKEFYRADDAVSLTLDIKNVKTLVVKVYEINAANYYREQQREVDTGLNLDGLIANQETPYNYDDAPLRRVRRTFDFPALKAPGVYFVDFIGNGKSSRAVISKGRLHTIERSTSAGHILNVLDESNAMQKEASLWLSGHEYKANKDGDILVPFTNAPVKQKIVLASGNLVSLDAFQHRSENYKLSAGIHVEREELLKRKKAQIVVRPMFYINGTPIGFDALEEVTLVLHSTDTDGISTMKEVHDFKLQGEKESVYEFQVPEKISALHVLLKAKIQVLSQNRKQDLLAERTFALNEIDKTDHFADVHFSRLESGYALTVLGKSGEPLPDRAINIQLKHRHYTELIDVTLKSGADGRIALGKLDGIVTVSTPGVSNVQRVWAIEEASHSLPQSLFGKSGETLRVPYMGTQQAPERGEFSLLEKRGNGFLHDNFEALSLKDGLLEIAKLPEGDYDLFLKRERAHIDVKVSAGSVVAGYVSSNVRKLELSENQPLQISAVEVTPDTIKVTLKNANKFTRLHASATHFQTSQNFVHDLGSIEFEEPSMLTLAQTDSHYLAGRDIGDEYRYILDRRLAMKFPGNMLNRPSLLLNPWALRTTVTGNDVGSGRGSFGNQGGGGRKLMAKRNGGSMATLGSGDNFANLDFLPTQSPLLANLRPDANGVVTISRKDLGSGQQLHLFAADPTNSVYRQLVLPEQKTVPVDLRLVKSFDPAKHFTERKQVTALEGNQKLEVADISSSSVEVYDSVGKAYSLYQTLSGNGTLNEFNFITRWPTLNIDEKRTNYSKNACHELSFFLMKKDPEFFKTVIQPYLKNKKDKTFVDHFLLEDDLSAYLKPWAYGQLNIVERILLIQRIKDEGTNGARHVRELFEMLPPDFEHFNSLYLTAIKGSELDTGDALGITGAQNAAAAADPAKPGERQMLRGATMAVPPAPASAPMQANGQVMEAQKWNAQLKYKADKSEEGGEKLQEEALAKRELKDEKASAGLNRGEFAKKAADGKGEDRAAGRKERRDTALAFDSDMDMRKQVEQFYTKLDKTEEWVENNYYKLPIGEQRSQLITVNAFWNDYASYLSKGAQGGFKSTNLAEAGRNFTEIMFALSVLDLPFEAQKHTTEFNGAKMTFTAKSPVIVFHKEIKEGADGGKSPILVSENFFKLDDRYRFENNEKYEKYISEEFLTHAVYGCQVVLTNPTANPMKLELLLQIPEGAIAVRSGFKSKGVHLNLAPYSTNSTEYYFYFPGTGKFAHYPVQVAKNEKIVAFTAPETLNVVEQLTKADTTSWDYISQNGKNEEVIAYLNNNNVERLNLELIAWRMKDAAFFTSVTTLLAQRHVYQNTLWSYSIRNNDVATAREFLQHDDGFMGMCGPILDSKLVSIDPVVRKSYEHMEYSPLVNARTHRFGKERKILNDAFSGQYQRLLHVLSYKTKLDPTDMMAVTYYMLLQDRVEEGLAAFAKVDPAAIATKMQYDFFKCHALYFAGDAAAARLLADRYTDYPVLRWRNTFAEVRAQCDEIEGKQIIVVDKDDKRQKTAALADTEPNIDFNVEARKITINYKNLSECRIDYYLMDIELLFSGNPFVQEYAGQFAYIRPNKTVTQALAAGQNTLTIDLPQEFHSSNVMVQISGGGKKKARAYYANSLAVQVAENYGQIKVTQQDGGKPVAKAYVKVYAKNKDGAVAFYKDGYTDLRGKLDFASLSTNELDNVQKFSILVMSENQGALVREAMPPKQ